MTVGSELMQQLTSGELARATPDTINKVRDAVVPALTELIDYGCRARPLLLRGSHIGFVRGIHPQERRQLYTWFPGPQDRVFHLLSLATTLSPDDINSLDGFEAQTLLRLIDRYTEADLSLYPYVSAYATTSASEVLWYGRGATVAAWTDRDIKLPGGYVFKLLAPPDHSRLWAGVANLRERAKRRLDDSYNAAMITRALTGKGADKLYAALKKNQQALQPDVPDAWSMVVRPDLEGVDFGDGWGHSHQDDSVEGVMREISGMNRMDKHEKFMAAFYDEQMRAAQAQEEAMEHQFQQALADVELEDSYHILTPEQRRAQHEAAATALQHRDTLVNDAITTMHAAEERRESRQR